MTPNTTHNRALQQEARAWSQFTGTKYTAALRQVSSPFAQGILGERVNARQMIRTLAEHNLVGEGSLGAGGYRSESPWQFNGKTDFIELCLITEFLRLFTPAPAAEVSSYSLKHTAEYFLNPHSSYVSNGQLIWAAAAMGLSITGTDSEGPNLLIGVTEREHHYVRRMVGPGQSRPHVDHFQPAGYTYLREALTKAAAGEPIMSEWVPQAPATEPAPFHDWLISQIGRDDVVGDLAGDYSAGVRDSDHRIAHTAGDLLTVFREVSHSPEAYNAVVRAIAEWMETKPSPAPIRTEKVGGSKEEHAGWGAGSGTTERYEYYCPCGEGTISEEHDNVPGFRDHSVRIICGRCREEWRFAEGRDVRSWALEPSMMSTAA
ncbi:MAG: hypothetical protein ACTJGT_03970 [Microbacteriaceae bacterium]